MLRRRQLRPGEKRGAKVGKTKRGKGTKWMLLVDGQGTPLGVHLDSASPAEVQLLEQTLASVQVEPDDRRIRPPQPKRLIGDRAFDSNPARVKLKKRGIDPIIPARSNNRRATDQDGRKLRRYKHRWIVERTFAWLGWFRRLLVRHDRLMTSYGGFFHMACMLLTLRLVLK